MQFRGFPRLAVMLVACGAFSLACASTKGPKTQTTPGSSGEFSSGENSGLGSGGSMSGSETEGQKVSELETIYFDFDSSTIRDDQKPTLRADGMAIKNTPSWKRVMLQGYTDERGSEEYNLALGERRANSVKQYLVDLGVPAARLDTVSFGESKPAVEGHDESAWKWNRRVEFRVFQ
jgi:peptidoglycan-associated lipoprotein